MKRTEIEELGWVYIDLPNGKYLIDNYYKIVLRLKKADIEFRLRLIGGNITIWSEDTDNQYFDGTIKTQLELQILMRQIGCV
mgnify:CR=1 FL=1